MLAQPRLLSWLRHKPSNPTRGSFHNNNQDLNTDTDTDTDSDTEKSIPYYAFRFVKPKSKPNKTSPTTAETSPVHATFASAVFAGLDQAEQVLRRVGVCKKSVMDAEDGDDEASSSSSVSEAPSTPSLASPPLSSSSVEDSDSQVSMGTVVPNPFSGPGSLYVPTYESRSKESAVAHANASIFPPFGSLFLPLASHKKNTDIKSVTTTKGHHCRLYTAELASDDDEVLTQSVRGKHAGFLSAPSPPASADSGPVSAQFFSFGSVSGGFNSVNDCDGEDDDLEDGNADEFDVDLEACVRFATDEEGDDESSECSSASASIASRTGPPPTPVLDYPLLPRLVAFEDAELDALDSLKTFAPPAALLPRTTVTSNANAVCYTCPLKVKGKDADDEPIILSHKETYIATDTDIDTVRPSCLFAPPRAQDLLRMTGPVEAWYAPLDVVRFVSAESAVPPPAHARAHALPLSPFSRDPFGSAMMQPFRDQNALFVDEAGDEAGEDDEESSRLISDSVFDPVHTRDVVFSRCPFPANESALPYCPVDGQLPAGVPQEMSVIPHDDSFDDFPVCEMSRAMGLHD